MNGLSPDTIDGLKAKIRAFQDHHAGGDLPKCDAAYDRLYPDQIDRFTFRQAWVQVTNERAADAAEAGETQGTSEPGTADEGAAAVDAASGPVDGAGEHAAGSVDPTAAE